MHLLSAVLLVACVTALLAAGVEYVLRRLHWREIGKLLAVRWFGLIFLDYCVVVLMARVPSGWGVVGLALLLVLVNIGWSIRFSLWVIPGDQVEVRD